MVKIKIVETESIPLCPHCTKELKTIERVAKGFIEQTVVFLCPHCKKVLSIGYNVGW